MNKVFSINLGGYPFTIDEDAYEQLRQYLDTIHRHFRRSDGYEEITQDIESRLAELFREHLGNRPIVTSRDVEAAISIMGTPEEFGADPVEDGPAASGKGKGSGYQTGKRLFRDPEESVIGGVSSGIAAYLGIADPLWVRLAFIIAAVSGGFGIPLYVILWAILPEAKTAGDRLAMRGEPINVSNIGRIIEEEIQHLSHKVSEFSNEFSGKKKRAPGEGGDRVNPIEEGISFLGRLIRSLIDLIARIWRPLLMLIGIILIIGFAVAWIGSIVGIFFGLPLLAYLFPDQTAVSAIGTLNLLFMVSIPVIGILLLISRLLFGTRLGTPWKAGLTGFFLLNMLSFFFIASLAGREFAAGAEIEEEISLGPVADSLELFLADDPYRDVWFNIDDEVKYTGNELLLKEVRLFIRRGGGDSYRLVRESYSRGPDPEEAGSIAQRTSFDLRYDGKRLSIPPYLVIPQGVKWRGQHIKLFLEIPEGKTVFLGDGIGRVIRQAELQEGQNSTWREGKHYWRMNGQGLVCTDCSTEGNLSMEER